MKRTGPTNPIMQSLITELKVLSNKQGAGIWRRIALDLEKPTRGRRVVNISRISKYAVENEIIVVPGKVLGAGDLDRKLTIAAWQFSSQAKEKIVKAKGSTLTIHELMKKNPNPSQIRVLG